MSSHANCACRTAAFQRSLTDTKKREAFDLASLVGRNRKATALHRHSLLIAAQVSIQQRRRQLQMAMLIPQVAAAVAASSVKWTTTAEIIQTSFHGRFATGLSRLIIFQFIYK